MRLRWFLAFAIIFAWAIVAGGQMLPVRTNAHQPPALTFRTQANAPDPNQIFALVNAERKQKGSPPLTPNAVLTQVAQKRAADMAANKYYGHKNASGKIFEDFIEQSAMRIDYGCENLDMQSTLYADTYVNDWLQSNKGHRECLLNPNVTQAGYAVTAIELNQPGGATFSTYVVVAIHTGELKDEDTEFALRR